MSFKKSKSIKQKLDGTLFESGLVPIMENRGHRPAVITMKRGTVIPVHHFRKIVNRNGRTTIIAGIDPGRWETNDKGGGYSSKYPTHHDMRDFYNPGYWVPMPWQDEDGWDDPLRPREERVGASWGDGYDAKRAYIQVRKFRKILTMYEENIKNIKSLEPGTDVSAIDAATYPGLVPFNTFAGVSPGRRRDAGASLDLE
jgi:hypothetical protein